MATRQKAAKLPVIPNEQEQKYLTIVENSEEFGDDTPEERVYAMLENLSTEGKSSVKVYRLLDAGKVELCDEYAPAEFEAGGFKMIRETFGAGNFEIRLWGDNENGRYSMLKRQQITLAAMLSTAPVKQNESGINGAIEKLTQQIIDLKTAPLAAPVDQFTMMTQMFGFMKLMREAMGDTDKPKNQLSEIVAAMRELREVSEEINPRPEKEVPDTLMGALGPILKIVADSQTAKQNQSKLPAPTIPASLQIDEPQAIPVPSTDQEKQVAYFQSQLQMLLMMAATNQNPEVCADSFYSLLPDEIMELLHQESWFKQLSAVEPRCNEYEAWITELRNHILAMVAEDNTADAVAQPVKKPPTPAITSKKKTPAKAAN